jgi:hypothetical protein
VREEFDHVREGKHGARSSKQVIAIGLSKARRAGVKLEAPSRRKTSTETRKHALGDYRQGQSPARPAPSAKRFRATTDALKKEGHGAASAKSIAKQAHASARERTAAERHGAALKAVRTKAKKRAAGEAAGSKRTGTRG